MAKLKKSSQIKNWRDRLDAEEADLVRREQLIEERKRIAAAWRPFENAEDYNKNEESAIFDMRGLTFEAVEKVARNMQRELSNKAMALDGAARDKPMWMAFGSYMLIENLRTKIKTFEGRAKRDAVKEENKAKSAPKKGARRTHFQMMNSPPGS